MKTMILAAGYGKRLRPITLSIPKPLVPVAGKPLITCHIERLAQAGFRELVINHGWLGEQIEQALGTGSHWGVNIQYSPEGEPLETGGGILQALPMLGDAPFMVINGDIYTNVKLESLALPEGMQAHLVMVDNPDFRPDGDFCLKDRLLFEKNKIPGGRHLTFSGVSVLSPRLFDGCPAGASFALAPLLIDAMKRGKVSGQYHDGFWTDVGSIVRLQALENYLQNQPQDNNQNNNQNNLQDQSRTS